MDGPESFGGFPEGGIPVTEAARADLFAELAASVEVAAQEEVSAQISADPVLEVMLSKLIETGPELDPATSGHLRKMVAWRIGGLIETGVQAGYDTEFFEMVENLIGGELKEMKSFEDDLSNVPDLWDLAYQDLLGLEGSAEEIGDEDGPEEFPDDEYPYDES